MAKKKRQTKAKAEKEAPEQKPITISEADIADAFTRTQWFLDTLEEIRHWREPLYVGIDPGMDGAIAFLHPKDNNESTVVDIPTVTVETSKKTPKGNKAKRTKFDIGGCKRIFDMLCSAWSPSQIVVALEQGQARASDSGLTGFSVGKGYFMWPLFLLEKGIECEELLPAVWKRKMNLLKKDKEWSRLTAQRLFPRAPLFRVGDHNRAEAMLIAEALKRTRSQ